MRVAVIYEPEEAAVQEMAAAVAAGVTEAGAEVLLRPVTEITPDEAAAAGGLIWGSAPQLGLPGFGLRRFMERLLRSGAAQQLAGKPGGVFCASRVLRGDREATLVALLEPMLAMGMAVLGVPDPPEAGAAGSGGLGAVAVGTPDAWALEQARQLGRRVAELAAAVAHSRSLAAD